MLILLNNEKKIIGLNLFPQYKKNLKNLEDFFKIIKNINNYIIKNNIELKEISQIKDDKLDETKKFFVVDINKDILKLFFENNNDNILEKEIEEINFEITDYEYKECINKEELKDLEINFINENFEENFWK